MPECVDKALINLTEQPTKAIGSTAVSYTHLQTGMYQIDRIEHFTENMRKMSHLEQRELQLSLIHISGIEFLTA